MNGEKAKNYGQMDKWTDGRMDQPADRHSNKLILIGMSIDFHHSEHKK